jgi:hypothetical protein
MTDKTTEALKLAGEALVYHTQQTRPIQKTDEAIAAIREALAEPVKQEPVGYTNKEQLRLLKDPRNPIGMWTTPFQTNNVPLYAAPVSVEAAVLAEREACAEVCDDMGKTMPDRDGEITEWCAAAIRARGEK